MALVAAAATPHTGAEEGEDKEGGEETEAAAASTKLSFSWLRLSSMSPGDIPSSQGSRKRNRWAGAKLARLAGGLER